MRAEYAWIVGGLILFAVAVLMDHRPATYCATIADNIVLGCY